MRADYKRHFIPQLPISLGIKHKMLKKLYSFEFWATPKPIAVNSKLTLTDKVVLSSLITRHNGENRLRVKQITIAKDWGISERSVRKSIAKLEKRGLIESLRLGKKLCNQYEIRG